MRGVEEFNGYVCADGARVEFPFGVSDALRVEKIPFVNHPAYVRGGTSKRVLATRDIHAGEDLGYYAGQLIPRAQLEEGAWMPYMFELPSADYVVDGRVTGNVLRYINDFRSMEPITKPNVMTTEVFLENSDLVAVLFSAECDVKEGDELLLDYGEEYWRAQYAHYEETHPYACEQCSYRGKKKRNLRKHKQAVHDKPVMHKCRFCTYDNKFKWIVRGHENKKHLNFNPYECKYEACNKRFPDSNTRQSHYRKEHPKPMYECRYCKKTYVYYGSFNQHVLFVHERQRIGETKRHQSGPFKCDFCDERQTTIVTFRKHVYEKHKNENWFHCNQCTTVTWSQRALKIHTRRIHTLKDLYVCTEKGCTFSTSVLIKYEYHQAVHKKEIVKTCDICNVGCYSDIHYYDHTLTMKHFNNAKKMGLDIKSVHCDVCQLEFPQTKYLTLHTEDMMHTMKCEKPLPINQICFDCNAFFNSKKNYRQHFKSDSHRKRKHSGPFTPTLETHCKPCQFQTDTKKNIRKHFNSRAHKRQVEIEEYLEKRKRLKLPLFTDE